MGSAASSPSSDEIHERAEERASEVMTELRTSIWRTECEIKTLEKQLKSQLGAAHNKNVAEILASKRVKIARLYAALESASKHLDEIVVARMTDKTRALNVDVTNQPTSEAAEQEIQMAMEIKLPTVPKQ